MFVQPAGRGRGIGSLLLEHVLDLARAAGRRRLVLDTRDELVEAIALYRRHGFVEIAAYNANPYSTSWWAREIEERGDG